MGRVGTSHRRTHATPSHLPVDLRQQLAVTSEGALFIMVTTLLSGFIHHMGLRYHRMWYGELWTQDLKLVDETMW